MKSYRTMCKKTWAVILAIACHLPATWATNANEIELIPKPVHVEQTSGNFRLSPKSTIGYDAALQGQAEYLQQVLGQSTGWDLKLKKDARKATILLTLNPTSMVCLVYRKSSKSEAEHRWTNWQHSGSICGSWAAWRWPFPAVWIPHSY